MRSLEKATTETRRESTENAFVGAYLEGNLRLPQSMLGMAIVLGRTSLKNNVAFEASDQKDFSPHSLTRIKDSMNRAHAAHGIDHRSADAADPARHTKVPEGRIQALFADAKVATSFLLASVFGHPGIAKADDELIDDIRPDVADKRADMLRRVLPDIDMFNKRNLADPTLHENAVALFDSFYDSLISPAGKELAREWRNTVGFRVTPKLNDTEVQKARDEAAIEIRGELVSLLVDDAEAKGLRMNDQTKDFLARL